MLILILILIRYTKMKKDLQMVMWQMPLSFAALVVNRQILLDLSTICDVTTKSSLESVRFVRRLKNCQEYHRYTDHVFTRCPECKWKSKHEARFNMFSSLNKKKIKILLQITIVVKNTFAKLNFSYTGDPRYLRGLRSKNILKIPKMWKTREHFLGESH